jgi:hypothetical protein
MLKGAKVKLYEDILDAAKEHGEQSNPDMEAGDLQEAVEALIHFLPFERIDGVRRKLEDNLSWKEDNDG